MNAKQAKSLRRLARAVSAAQPWEAYYVDRVPSWKFAAGFAPVFRLHPDCGKAWYRQFKRNYRRLTRREAAALQIVSRLRRAAKA